MNNTCSNCSLGKDTKPGGKKPSPGTVWCAKRSIQMGKSRVMSCFVPRGGVIRTGKCFSCKWAGLTSPLGEAPAAGYIWCKKKRMAMHKNKSMECFEKK